MGAGSVDTLLSALYELVLSEAVQGGEAARTSRGHHFEDATAQKVYECAQGLGLKALPPRLTLDRPTLSGLRYQFDTAFTVGEATYVVECKRRRVVAREQIQCFNAKILDHAFSGLEMHGIFLSTAPLDDSSMTYAIAYGIAAIDPESPPIAHILGRTERSEPLNRALLDLQQRIHMSPVSPATHRSRILAEEVLREYRFLVNRWRSV